MKRLEGKTAVITAVAQGIGGASGGKGWQHFGVPLKCFTQDRDNFSAVNVPF